MLEDRKYCGIIVIYINSNQNIGKMFWILHQIWDAACTRLSIRYLFSKCHSNRGKLLSSLPRWCAETGEPLITAELIERYCQLVRGEAGPDFWWSLSLQQILEGTGLEAASYRRGEDILDIWFDSGISWAAVIGTFTTFWPLSLAIIQRSGFYSSTWYLTYSF